MSPAPASASPRPDVVLLDVGGVFLLPEPSRILGVFTRAGYEIPEPVVTEAHYVGTTAFTLDGTDGDSWAERWHEYLVHYTRACGIPEAGRREVVAHLEAEFTTGRLWTHVIDGAPHGLRELQRTGVKLGIVSNADGLVAEDLREREVLQVGPGMGVEVACIIDSALVGVEKPDPRIFKLALDAIDGVPEHTWYVGDTPGIDVTGARRAGLHAVLMDPYDVHTDLDVERVHSLHELAARVNSLRSAQG